MQACQAPARLAPCAVGSLAQLGSSLYPSYLACYPTFQLSCAMQPCLACCACAHGEAECFQEQLGYVRRPPHWQPPGGGTTLLLLMHRRLPAVQCTLATTLGPDPTPTFWDQCLGQPAILVVGHQIGHQQPQAEPPGGGACPGRGRPFMSQLSSQATAVTTSLWLR